MFLYKASILLLASLSNVQATAPLKTQAAVAPQERELQSEPSCKVFECTNDNPNPFGADTGCDLPNRPMCMSAYQAWGEDIPLGSKGNYCARPMCANDHYDYADVDTGCSAYFNRCVNEDDAEPARDAVGKFCIHDESPGSNPAPVAPPPVPAPVPAPVPPPAPVAPVCVCAPNSQSPTGPCQSSTDGVCWPLLPYGGCPSGTSRCDV